MEYVLRSFQKSGVFGWLYLASLLHGFHFFAVHYINSSYLEQFLSQSDVGLMFALSSALTLLLLATTAVFLAKYGGYNVALVATALNFASTLGLAAATDVGWIFVFFAIHTMLIPVTLFCFDVFLESNNHDESRTGSIRGIFLSMALLSALFSPIISGHLVNGDGSHYEWAYLASALYLLPVLVVINMQFKHFVDPHYELLSPKRMVAAIWQDKNLFHVSMAQFLMRFFFTWNVVYLPIYLHQHIGFTWPEIGIILFFMLVPYVLIEYPAGKVADKWLGEKELMAAGFVITALSTAGLFWIQSDSLWLWAGMLMLTRVGCALIESMTETYFFKQIDGDDTSILSIFRMLRPLAYSIGPAVAAGLLLVTSLQYLWLILAAIMLLGIIHPLRLQDTK